MGRVQAVRRSELAAKFVLAGEGHVIEGWTIVRRVMRQLCTVFYDTFFNAPLQPRVTHFRVVAVGVC